MTLVTLRMSLIPVSIGIAVLRHRLFDIDLIINRGLVYVVLTAGVVAIYVRGGRLPRHAVPHRRATCSSRWAPPGWWPWPFAPLRELVQRGVNHLMYGERDDPYTVAVAARRQPGGDARARRPCCPAAVDAVAEALKLPVRRGGGRPRGTPSRRWPRPACRRSRPGGAARRLPRASPRGGWCSDCVPASTSSLRADRRLLRRPGPAGRGRRCTPCGSTADLQRSRERLVTPREEERRRLRRDLHDGLGPAAGRADDAGRGGPRAGATAPDRRGRDARASWSGSRTTRSPTSAAWSTSCALRRSTSSAWSGRCGRPRRTPRSAACASRCSRPTSCRRCRPRSRWRPTGSSWRPCTTSPGTPAAALVRGAAAAWTATALEVVVADDGAASRRHTAGDGVGLGSMRERAEELGGRCVWAAVPGGGTQRRRPCCRWGADVTPTACAC